MKTILFIMLFFATTANGQQAGRSRVSFNGGWQLLALDSSATGKADATVVRDNSFKSQFDEQYVKDNKDDPGVILQKEKDEAIKGFDLEYPAIKNKTWKNVSLPCPVRYEQMLNPGPKSFQGICYYRKSFTIPKNLEDQELSLLFEGAMQTASVWVNGKFVMQHSGGYTPFTVHLNEFIKKDASNEMIIRLDNRDDAFTPPGKPLNRNGFLYWSGIYRDAWLVATPSVHITDAVTANTIAGGGVFIRSENISGNSATVLVKVQVKNAGATTAEGISLLYIIKDEKGKTVKEFKTTPFNIPAGTHHSFDASTVITTPLLWSPQSPHLYTLSILVKQNNTLLDMEKEKFGIRHLYFSRKEGFKLNGKPVHIRGTNLHQDYPFIGNAVSNEAHLRDLVKIKNAGFNFVRLPHYPHDPSVYDNCDSLGLMVADCIPGWQFFNNNPLFGQRVFRDVQTTIRRDRNHPSVILWEVSLNESLPPAAFRKATVKVAKEEYPGDQFYTSGDIYDGADSTWDVAYNHWEEPFGRPQDVQPNTPGFVREYGDYEFGGSRSTTRKRRGDGQKALLQNAWNLQWEHNILRGPLYYPWTVGDANWAFYDGGEGWTTNMSDWGIADIYHIPKFSYDFFRSQAHASEAGPIVSIANWWNAYKGPEKIIVYSNGDSVALFLNNKLLAIQKPDNGPDTDYGSFTTGGNPFDGGNCRNLDHAPFTFINISWAAGALKAVAYLNGRPTATSVVRSAGTATEMQLSADLQGIPLVADNADAVFVHAAITDKQGTIVTADNETTVSFYIEGPGQIVSPTIVKARGGIASVLLKASGKEGSITVKASAAGLRPSVLKLKSYKK